MIRLNAARSTRLAAASTLILLFHVLAIGGCGVVRDPAIVGVHASDACALVGVWRVRHDVAGPLGYDAESTDLVWIEALDDDKARAHSAYRSWSVIDDACVVATAGDQGRFDDVSLALAKTVRSVDADAMVGRMSVRGVDSRDGGRTSEAVGVTTEAIVVPSSRFTAMRVGGWFILEHGAFLGYRYTAARVSEDGRVLRAYELPDPMDGIRERGVEFDDDEAEAFAVREQLLRLLLESQLGDDRLIGAALDATALEIDADSLVTIEEIADGGDE